MLTGELRSKIDSIWNDFWSGGISNPLSGHRADHLPALHPAAGRDADAVEESKADALRQADGAAHLPGRARTRRGTPYEDLRWSRFKNFEPREMFKVVAEHVFPFLRTLGGEGERLRDTT